MTLLKHFYLRLLIRFRKITIDNRFFIFIFFLFVATIFWFLNALSKEYTTELTYPVSYTNIPTDKLLISNPPDELSLKVSAYGFILLKHNFRKNIMPLHINATSPPLTKMPGSKNQKYYLLTQYVINSLDNQLTNDIKIDEITPDTLLFEFINVISKKVPVVPDFDIHFVRQFTLKNDYIIEPDSIMVYGPENIIDTIRFVSTKHHDFKNISSTFSDVYELKDYELLKLSEKKVEIEVPVEKYTQVKFEINVEVVNVPNGITLKTFPRKVSISYLVGYSQYYNVNKEQVRAVVDYMSLSEGQKHINVKLLNPPENIIDNSLSVYPPKLDYIIEK